MGKQRFFREGVQLKPRTTGKFGEKEMDFLLGAIDQAVMIGSRLYKEGSQGSLGSGAEKAQEQGSARIAAVDARKQQLMKSGLKEHDAWLQARKEVMASEGARSDAAEAALGETGPKSAAYEGFTGSLSGRQPDNFALAQPERVQPLGAGARTVATGRVAPEEEYELGLLAGAQAYRDQAAVPGTEAYREKWSREGQAVAESPAGRLSSWENPENLPPMATVNRGASGSHVASLQRLLNAHGAGLRVDGIFGPRTQARVAEFQEWARLPVTGAIDQVTVQALSQSPAAPQGAGAGMAAPQAQPQQIAQPQQPPPRTPDEQAAKQYLTSLPPERQNRVVAAAK
ncbi:MAG: peptidoglycan-binding domain-containing protein, partial [Planctomycetota bacterium]|nr:peptidoglycan-binding domain-containing protein [Planctomycetota bacterium]